MITTTPGARPGPARPDGAVASATPEGTPTRRWRAWRTPIAASLVVLLAGTAIALLQAAPSVIGYLSPDDKGPTGTHALADILAARGHDVKTVTTVPAAVGAATPNTTLVITSPYLLTVRQLRELGRTPASVVVAEPDQDTLRALAPQVSLSGGASVGPLAPSCPLRAAILAGPADLGGPGLHVTPAASITQCYPVGGLPTLVQIRSGGRLVTLLSSGAPLANGYLGHQGNAALAINLLSARGPVVWLVPQFVLPASGATSGSRPFLDQVPLAAWLVAVQLALALLLAALWRARRLGPLIIERLPVVVRASETVEGHARLYRSRRARDRVAATLRQAAVARLAPAIGLPPTADPPAVTAALTARSARDQAEIGALLYGPPPGSDAELVTLASDLDALEGEVRRQ
ncbi:MAG TPA: DUF4350 domain-containing protein [Streptosporangiaceae bacterium]|nr:DUF4350 domain-containing protein [Streptosporangiaceae bacterium]